MLAIVRRSLPTLAALCALAVLSAPAGADECLTCHADRDMLEAGEGDPARLLVDERALDGSPHEGFSCTDCHADLEPDAMGPHDPPVAAVDCGTCHAQPADDLTAGSVHGWALDAEHAEQTRGACSACHGTHQISELSGLSSQAHANAVAKICGQCHEGSVLSPGPSDSWRKSIHGRAALEWDVADAPNCVACHGAHTIGRPEDPHEPTSRERIIDTCGACHPSEKKAVLRGVHGEAWSRGVMAAAVCSDCHQSHRIYRPGERSSSVYANAISRTCGKCHDDPELTNRFKLRPDRVATYKDSYHGKGDAWGADSVANCASCHGYHDIRGQRDPASQVHPANLQQTCRGCHPAATASFVSLPVHAPKLFPRTPWVRRARVAYILIISLSIALMVVHQVLEVAALRRQRRERAVSGGHGEPSADDRGDLWLDAAVFGPGGAPLTRPVQDRSGRWKLLRWDQTQIRQHLVLAISFSLLVLTGFPLQFPASWARHLGDLGPALFSLRGTLHRISAVVMLAVSLFHVFWALFSARGRREILELLPQPLRFLGDLRQTIAWFFGMRKLPPEGRRYTYREKFEYWALVWGTLVMAVSGVVLWTAPRWPSLVVELSEVIHGYEALLAFLAIIVWHMIGVHLKPGVYPMNPTWLTGEIPWHLQAEEHAAELRDIRRHYGRDGGTER